MRTVFLVVLFAFFITFSSFLPLEHFHNNKTIAASNAANHNINPGNIVPDSRALVIGNAIASIAQLMYDSLQLYKFGLPKEAFHLAISGYQQLLNKQLLNKPQLLCIADLSQSSNQKRFYIINLNKPEVLCRTWVAHGRNSGEEYACSFSNKPSSYKSSLGFYVTLGTYYGANGYSLKLRGMEKGFNDKAEQREIVMHGANYVSEQFIASNGHLGRSQGCPAIPFREHKKIIELIKDGACLFIYHPSKTYLKKSRLIDENA
jgi:L,D-transpeptidase catalytic domain